MSSRFTLSSGQPVPAEQPPLYRSEAFAEDVADEIDRAGGGVRSAASRWAGWPVDDAARVHAAAARVLALTSALMGLRRC